MVLNKDLREFVGLLNEKGVNAHKIKLTLKS